ncbi:hypothetical protein ABZ609_30750 [Streptomyces rubiginosohelvolus]|uniref:hypothetical protein n=1 Tax=Streptomyces rubiginosohelvolus TaxID=67362 RepID=UPI003405C56C
MDTTPCASVIAIRAEGDLSMPVSAPGDGTAHPRARCTLCNLFTPGAPLRDMTVA